MESFVRNEIAATEERLAVIRSFMDRLKFELAAYASDIPLAADERENFTMVLGMFRNMLTTYDEEVQMLVRKRERLLEHLMEIRLVTPYLKPASLPQNYLVN
jgi:hypothetical protein